MAICVEFFGIARQRAGRSELELAVREPTARLGDLLNRIAATLPEFGELVAGGQLHESLTANVDGAKFVRDPATLIRDGQSLLILSADAGG